MKTIVSTSNTTTQGSPRCVHSCSADQDIPHPLRSVKFKYSVQETVTGEPSPNPQISFM